MNLKSRVTWPHDLDKCARNNLQFFQPLRIAERIARDTLDGVPGEWTVKTTIDFELNDEERIVLYLVSEPTYACL